MILVAKFYLLFMALMFAVHAAQPTTEDRRIKLIIRVMMFLLVVSTLVVCYGS